jgi:glycosyltransferase involved in cell wall biosynthesis
MPANGIGRFLIARNSLMHSREIQANDRPHVLILPSEEYIPARAPLAGIFQQHQIDAIRPLGEFNFGVISNRLKYSVLMYARAMANAAIGRRVDNDLGAKSLPSLISDGTKRLFTPQKFLTTEDQGYPVLRATGLYLTPPSSRVDHYWWVRLGWMAFKHYCARYGPPNLVHAHNCLNAGFLAEHIKRRTGIPFVLTEHSSYFHQGLVPETLKARIATVFAEASAALVVSETLSKSIEHFLGSSHLRDTSLTVMPNVLPPSFECIEGAAAASSTDLPFMFLCVASHLPIKGLDILLHAFALLGEQHNACRLRLVGDGPLRTDLEQQARDLGIDGRVAFLGLQDAASVRREMLFSNALVLSSRYETFGVVVIEAMACGLPVIATKCGGPEGVITPETGLLAESGDAENLARTMAHLIDTRRRYQPSKIRHSVIARFGQVTFAERMSKIYYAALDASSQGTTAA